MQKLHVCDVFISSNIQNPLQPVHTPSSKNFLKLPSHNIPSTPTNTHINRKNSTPYSKAIPLHHVIKAESSFAARFSWPCFPTSHTNVHDLPGGSRPPYGSLRGGFRLGVGRACTSLEYKSPSRIL